MGGAPVNTLKRYENAADSPGHVLVTGHAANGIVHENSSCSRTPVSSTRYSRRILAGSGDAGLLHESVMVVSVMEVTRRDVTGPGSLLVSTGPSTLEPSRSKPLRFPDSTKK